MAGYVIHHLTGRESEFHIGDENVVEKIRRDTNKARVIVLQLDGDELDAALWGLENYKKPTN